MSTFIAVHRPEVGDARVLTERADVVAAIRQRQGITWLHFPSLRPEDAGFLEEDLGLHPLAVEDCLSDEYQRPKIDDHGDYVFMVLHGIDYERTDESVRTAELDIFVGQTFVISSTLVDMGAVHHLAEQVSETPAVLPATPAVLAYALVDALVDGIVPVVERMADVTDLIEDEALANPNPALLEHLVRLKRSVMRMARVTTPQRELIGQVSRGQYPLLSGSTAMLFRDVFDHLLRVEDMTNGLRDRADHAVSTYHSALSIKQNETMRVLSIVASIFLPLTLLAGVYGMNFDHMPELGWEYAYFAVLGFMLVVIGVGTYILFGRALLGWGRDRIGDVTSFALEPPVITETLREAARLRTRLMTEASRLTGREREGH